MEDNQILDLIKTKRDNTYSDYIFKTNLIKTIEKRNLTYIKLHSQVKELKMKLQVYDDLLILIDRV